MLANAVDRALDEDGVISRHKDANPGDLPVDALDLFPHAGRHRHRVLAGLLADLHAHGRASVDRLECAPVLGGVDDFCDVAEINGDTLPRHDHDVADIVKVRKFTLAAY